MYITLTENLSFKFRAMAACIHLMSTVQIVVGERSWMKFMKIFLETNRELEMFDICQYSYRHQINRVNKILFVLLVTDVACIFYHGEDLESSITNKLQDFYKITMIAYIICVIVTIRMQQESINCLTFHPTALSLDFRTRCQNMRRFYMNLNRQIKYFNEVFGLHLLLMTLNGFLVLVLLTVIYSAKIELRLFYIIINSVGPLAIMYFCGSTYNDSRRILSICHKLQQNIVLLEEEQKEIRKLLKQVSTIAPEITASGFFKMRKSTILSFFNISMTYIIVLSQFCNSNIKCNI
ncbi:unnamed protein product [Acanthoscelides obtectus]|uniref:Gustatory receptor n=1 Tax=Acanthoscelides obtectus TaxID=200917 RepID=A0A9P0NVT0_ACAOB|nr:unnamed protein product [Acanthoscelides obtectus]CAK1665627.1 hypothetical protein AOBTE_LOCUS24905 [Acanthoscelides obtectus]